MSDGNGSGPAVVRPGGRVPPHDLHAEAAVLSAVMLHPETVDMLTPVLRADMFYSDANRHVYQAVLALHDSNTPVDIITVRGELKERGRLEQVGGSPYLTMLVDVTPSVAEPHVEKYAKTIRELWRKRQVIALCHRFAAEGYGDVGAVQDWIESAEKALGEISVISQVATLEQAGAVLDRHIKALEEARARGEHVVGTPTGLRDLDKALGGLFDGDLYIVAARPGAGKSALACNLAMDVAEGSGYEPEQREAVAFFSLEMPREQVAVRFGCMRKQVQLSDVRMNKLSDAQWNDLADAADELSTLPLWIDDTPALTLPALRSKVRKLAREIATGSAGIACRRLGLIVVDYMQLMKGERGKHDTREREVSSLSQGLKNLAKELAVPVIALSQLNRGVEKKGTKDKRPGLADLRECVTGDTRIMLADGSTPTIAELEGKECQLWSLDGFSVVPAMGTVTRRPRRKKTIRVRTGTGRTLRASPDHPVLTINGWRSLNSVAIGEEIAVPRRYPSPPTPRMGLDVPLARLLGYLVSNGSYKRHRCVGVTMPEAELREDVQAIGEKYFGVKGRIHKHWSGTHTVDLTQQPSRPHGNPVINWLRSDLGIHGEGTFEKRTPELVFCSNQEVVAAYLGGLFAGDGSVVSRKSGGVDIKYTTTSPRLAADVQHLLLRVGIQSTRDAGVMMTKSTRPLITLRITSKAQVLQFMERVPLPGRKGRALSRYRRWAEGKRRNERIDRLPSAVEREIFDYTRRKKISWARLGYRCQGKRVSRADLGRVADVCAQMDPGEALPRRWRALACADVLWDPIVAKDDAGTAPVYDIAVPDLHCFMANDIVVHNSGAIEQDADTVIFIYREGYYDPTANQRETELIIGKQRNGPTCTVEVMFEKKYTRFYNSAHASLPPELEDLAGSIADNDEGLSDV